MKEKFKKIYNDLIQKFLIQEDKEGFIPCIIYLLNS